MLKTHHRQRGMPFVLRVAAVAVFTGATLAIASVASAAIADEERLTLTKKSDGSARESGDFASATTDSHAALKTGVDKSEASIAPPGVGVALQNSIFGDFWFYAVDVELFNDTDRDGYSYGIDVLFDADTIYSVADVYAVAYLSYEGGPWNEYAVSDDFTLFGATSTDDYVLVTELLQGYPAGFYDLLLELYDADTGRYLAAVGPEESIELVGLPLEDADRDLPPSAVTPLAVSSGGGASGTAFLVALLGVLLLNAATRRRKRCESA